MPKATPCVPSPFLLKNTPPHRMGITNEQKSTLQAQILMYKRLKNLQPGQEPPKLTPQEIAGIRPKPLSAPALGMNRAPSSATLAATAAAAAAAASKPGGLPSRPGAAGGAKPAKPGVPAAKVGAMQGVGSVPWVR